LAGTEKIQIEYLAFFLLILVICFLRVLIIYGIYLLLVDAVPLTAQVYYLDFVRIEAQVDLDSDTMLDCELLLAFVRG
jgi:hypothetical protein